MFCFRCSISIFFPFHVAVSVNYNLFYKGADKGAVNVSVAVVDKEGERAYASAVVENGSGNVTGSIEIQNPKLWWPYLMSPQPGYLYTVEVTN
jgi:beta-glucuronidase